MKLFKIMDTAYENFDKTVNSYIKKTFNSLGISNEHSSVFTLIFNAIKGVMQNAMFYIEDALTEQNIYTATRKKSLYNLAKISGYEPFYGSAASGVLLAKPIRGAILDNNLTKIYIPNHSIIVNEITGTRYVLMLSSNNYVLDISKPLINHEFKIVEGTVQLNNFYAKGEDFESFDINTSSLYDKDYFKVYVNGDKYDICESIYDMSENEKQCVLTVGYDNSFSLIFGNGIYGKKLSYGDNISVEWLSHRGKKGNIMSSEKNKFKFYSAGTDTFGNNVNINNFIKLELPNCISGGIDADTVDIVRKMIGYNSRSLVLASENNFKLFFKRFSFIGRVNCFGEKNSLNIITVCVSDLINKATTPEKYLNELNIDNLYLTSDQENQILETINNSNKTFAGISVKFVKPIIRRYAIIFFIKEDDVFNRELIKESIRETIANYFINLEENIQIIYKSDMINTILNNCEHIKFLDINIISELGEQAYKNTYYEQYDLTMKDNNLNFTSTKIFYEPSKTPGLDDYGNISLTSKLEIPLLQGKFKYYPNKEIDDRTTSINIETLQYYFI